MVLCTYCGSLSTSTAKCTNCGGHFDLLSRQRTQNGMGPWYIRDQANPFHPGCSYETLRRLIERGRVRPDTVVRGPTTRQFWSFARNTPGVAHLLGSCHACHAEVSPGAASCPSCNASFIIASDRQHLGLAPPQLLPGDADPAAVADAAFGPATPPPPPEVARPEPPSVVTRPARPRRKSAGPMIAVVASVFCAAIALTAVVMMNRSSSSLGAASASEPAAESPSTDEAMETPPPVRPAPQGDAPNERIGRDAAIELPPADDEVDIAAADPDPQIGVPVSPSPPEDRPGGGDAVSPQVRSIAQMSVSELEEARSGWVNAGREDLVASADLRLAQLRLRSMFGRSPAPAAD
jgi:hypothetical protein